MTENNNFWLPAVVLFSAVLLAGTIFAVGGNINSNISGLATVLSSGNTMVKTAEPTVLQPSVNSGDSANNAAAIQTKDLIDGAAGVQGNENAPVILVEFSDYQCPFCRSWFNDSKGQLNDYIQQGKVLFVYHDFPLNSIHPMAETYAEAARCAGEQGKYFEFHDKVYSEQNKYGNGTVSSLTKDDVKQWAVDLGLDSTQFNSCLDSSKYSSQINAGLSLGTQLGVQGTPSFLIGKPDEQPQLIRGAQPYSTFKSLIDSLLS